nr:GSCFA domain-containing protein [Brevundimonas sp. SPF441]
MVGSRVVLAEALVPYTISVFGNCQANGVADCLAAMLPTARILPGFARDIREGVVDLDKILSSSDAVVTLTSMHARVMSALKALGRDAIPVVSLPTIYYTGFHPDFIHATVDGQGVKSPVGSGNSAIALAAWRAGLTVEQTLSLFRRETFEYLGYFDYDRRAQEGFLAQALALGFDFSEDVQRWRASGCFVHTPNHPKLSVLASLARAALKRLGIAPAFQNVEHLVPDIFSTNVSWPVYPEISDNLGVLGEYVFKPAAGSRKLAAPLKVFDLRGFVEGSFENYKLLEPKKIESARFDDLRYGSLAEILKPSGGHPYKGLPDHQFWNKSVLGDFKRIDPVALPGHALERDDLIATAGSCFAQHIARALSKSGYSYYVAESADGLSEDEATRRQFGVFSARYGNVYTGEQLAQLFDRADGNFVPADDVWRRPDGKFVDAFRPQVEPDGFDSEEAVLRARAVHFEAVRKMLRELDVFVFTLGLTEAWRSRADGAVYPLAPGVAAGGMDPEKYEFHNYTVEETISALERALDRLWSENPNARVILTVSPVPLAATYEPRHVLQSTTYSKSVLRVVAEKLNQKYELIEYFPSYEIITGSFNRGAYFEDDLRSVTADGVSHVMELFMKHHAQGERMDEQQKLSNAPSSREQQEGEALVCEEELLSRV